MALTAADPRPLDADQFRDITIYDRVGADRRRPRAVVYDGHRSYLTVDILASVENNASSVCHPAICRAIEKWEREIRARHLIRGGYERSKLAERHLEKLCAVLLTGVKRRITSPETALVEAESHLEKECEYLKAAWDFMSEDGPKTIKKRYGSTSPRLLSLIAQRLDAVRKGRGYEVDQIMFYISTKEPLAFLGRRKSWEATKNIYLAWRNKINSETARSYRNRAKSKNDWPDFPFLEAGSNHFSFPLNQDAEKLPLIYISQEA
jgi:hypothetical protein